MRKTTLSSPTLQKGESRHSNGKYQYRWTDDAGARHSIYAPTLDELRAKEALIEQDLREQIKPEARSVTLNDMFDLWKQLKRGLKDNTFQNYVYMYTQYAAPRFGQKRISSLVKSDVKRFYNTLVDDSHSRRCPHRRTPGTGYGSRGCLHTPQSRRQRAEGAEKGAYLTSWKTSRTNPGRTGIVPQLPEALRAVPSLVSGLCPSHRHRPPYW